MKQHIIILFAAVFSLLLLMQEANAAGTPAGTVISSRSKVVYTTASGARSDTIYSNSITITIAQVAAANITPATNSSVTNSDSTYVSYALTITNSGNGNDQFALSSSSTKGWATTFYHDANGNGVLDNAEITAGAISSTASIAADASYKIIARVFVPRDASLNNKVDTTTISAVSQFNNSVSVSGVVKTTVKTAYFSNIGSGLTVSPTNPQPGDNVTYTFSIVNNGSEDATGVSFSDLFPPSLFNFVSANNGGVNNSGTVNWNIGTIPGNGGSASIQLTLQVRPDLPNGTNLTNTIGVTYTVGGNTFTITSNSPYAAVGVIRGFSISPTTLSAAKETDDTLAYAFTIFNTGNSSDIGELSYSSTRGYSWTFFKDVNNNSILDNGDTQLHDTQGSLTGIDIDTLAAADSIKILARLIVPVVSSDQIQDVTTFTVKSNADQSKFQSAVGTTTIGKAVLSVVRSVTPSGNRPPGDEMTFTVTYQNVGHGKAYNVVLTETEPDSMSYVANSVTINNIAKTDAADGDEVTVTTNDGRKVITINVGTLNSLSTEATIKYRATIH